MNDYAKVWQTALVEIEVLHNLARLNVRPEAVRDLVDRLVKAGAQPGITGITMPSGGSALDYATDVILPEAEHLKRPFDEAVSARKVAPVKAKSGGRPTATEKLAAANGDDTEASL